MALLPTWQDKMLHIQELASYTHEATKTYPVPYIAPVVKPALTLTDWRISEILPHVAPAPITTKPAVTKIVTKDTGGATTQEYKQDVAAYDVNKFMQSLIPGYGLISTLLKTSSAPWDVSDRPLPVQDPSGQILTSRDTSPFLPIVIREAPPVSQIPAAGVDVGWAQGVSKWQNIIIIGAVAVGGLWLLGKVLGKKV